MLALQDRTIAQLEGLLKKRMKKWNTRPPQAARRSIAKHIAAIKDELAKRHLEIIKVEVACIA